jgi:hypothetical protein
VKEKAIEILIEQDTAAAIEWLKQQGDPQKVAEAFNDVMRHTYWQMQDLKSTVTLAQEGIGYASAKAKQAGGARQAKEFNNQVKAMSYNLASFVWPGWDEEWIEDIPQEYLKLGLDAAQTNLHLAIELEKGDLPISRAYWMLAAQQIAAEQYQEAKDNFTQAIEYAEKAEAHGDVLLSHGFTHVVKLLEDPENEEAKSSLEAIKSELVNLEHGEMLSQQMDDALKVFGKHTDQQR